MAERKFKEYITEKSVRPCVEGWHKAVAGIKHDLTCAWNGILTAWKHCRKALSADENGTLRDKTRHLAGLAKIHCVQFTFWQDLVQHIHSIIAMVFLYPFRVMRRFAGLFAWPLRYAIVTALFGAILLGTAHFNFNLLLISGLSEQLPVPEEKQAAPEQTESPKTEETESDGKTTDGEKKPEADDYQEDEDFTTTTLHQLTALYDAHLETARTDLANEAADRLKKAQTRIEEERKRAEEELKTAAKRLREGVKKTDPADKTNMTAPSVTNDGRKTEMKFVPPEEDKAYLSERGEVKERHIKDKYAERFKSAGFDTINLHYNELQMDALFQSGGFTFFNALCSLLGVIGCFMLVFAATSFVTLFTEGRVSDIMRRTAWRGMVYCGIAACGVLFICIFAMFDIPNKLLAMNRKDFDASARHGILFAYIWLWVIPFALSFFTWIPLLTSGAKKGFGLTVARRERGDELVGILTEKSERNSLVRASYWVFGYMFFFLMVVPLLRGCGPDDMYKPPKGDGGGQIQPKVQVVKKKKPKKNKKIIVNPNSAFIFDMPELDDKRSEELDEETANTYEADPTMGTMGPGKKGGKPGWPDGMDDGVVRFIRLEYSGGDWDQDMGKGADYNMLIKINEYAGFKIANETESIKVSDLRRFKRGFKPPFMYITGRGGINMTASEVKILRDYLLRDGGMLFADNGGGSFNGAFKGLCKRIVPELDFIDIANDDVIYKTPFVFPNGAPPLFHHSGERALGIKHNGRWIVYYHQGDINDAWKVGGSGVSPEIQERAYQLGANVISYAFTQYLSFNSEFLKKQRKRR